MKIGQMRWKQEEEAEEGEAGEVGVEGEEEVGVDGS